MHFTKNAARLHIGEGALEATNVRSHSLHFPKALVHQFQAFADNLERTIETGGQRCLEFFIHDVSHFIKLFLILFAQGGELRLRGVTHFHQLHARGFAGFRELLIKRGAGCVKPKECGFKLHCKVLADFSAQGGCSGQLIIAREADEFGERIARGGLAESQLFAQASLHHTDRLTEAV